MGLRPCRECHRFVSEEARSCPHCGVARPVAPAEDLGWLGRHRAAVALALAALTAEIMLFRSMAKELDAPPSPPPPAARVDSFPGYRSLANGVWLDARLYERADRTYVGRITSLACQDPTPRGILLRCFEVEFADGHREWVRWQLAVNRYLAALPSQSP
jgi:hypothetical protein